jgi:ribosomal protein S3AE
MSKQAKKQSKQIVKKKKWYSIVAPAMLGEKVLGESYLVDTETVEGRKLNMNLMQVTGDIKAQNSSVQFEVTGAKDSRIQTKLIGYEFLSAAVKRLIRRRMTRIDDSIVCVTKDGIKVRVKPLVMTRSKVSRSVEHSLRAHLRYEVISQVKNYACEELFSSVIKNKVQQDIKMKINVLYPLKGVIIRSLKIEKDSAKESELPVLKASKKGGLDSEERKERKRAEKKESEEDSVAEEIIEEKESEDDSKPKRRKKAE